MGASRVRHLVVLLVVLQRWSEQLLVYSFIHLLGQQQWVGGSHRALISSAHARPSHSLEFLPHSCPLVRVYVLVCGPLSTEGLR